MTYSRRDFLKMSGMAGVGLAMPKLDLKASQRLQHLLSEGKRLGRPDQPFRMLNKMGFGANKQDYKRLQKQGLEKYLEEQLNPKEEPQIKRRLRAHKMKIEYDAKSSMGMAEGQKVSEERPLKFLNMSLTECWDEYQSRIKDLPYMEWIRPAMEVMAANWMRAVHSRYQLRELMVDFWHNHFNVTVNADKKMGVLMPSYDRDVIRKHCLGNFRKMLGAVAKHPAMLYYLDNYASQASPANENYARELFELHTLGEEHYYNDLYDRWREVPGATEGVAEGYIDEDVYEAARAFTGWTVADGRKTWYGGRPEPLPNTGAFYYFEGWHDNYQKRILGVEIPSNQPPMHDGEKVLDLVGYHKGTAKHVCRKLCRRLVADEPSEELVQEAVNTWMQTQKDDDQMAQVLQTIILSDAFQNTYGEKVKRPIELVASFARAIDAQMTPNMMLHWVVGNLGQQMFMWPSPTGHPDKATFWMGPGAMARRWKIINTILMWKDFGAFKLDVVEQTDTNKSCWEIVDEWAQRITGGAIQEDDRQRVIDLLADGEDPEQPPPGNATHQLKLAVGLLAMTPEFQIR